MASHVTSKIVVLVTSAFGGMGGLESFNRALVSALDELASGHSWTAQVLSLLDREELPGADAYVRSAKAEVRRRHRRATRTFVR
jgi:hypothetical protein